MKHIEIGDPLLLKNSNSYIDFDYNIDWKDVDTKWVLKNYIFSEEEVDKHFDFYYGRGMSENIFTRYRNGNYFIDNKFSNDFFIKHIKILGCNFDVVVYTEAELLSIINSEHFKTNNEYEELKKYQPITLNIIKNIIKNRYVNFCYDLTKEKNSWVKTISDIKIETDKQFDSEYKILKSIQNFSNISWSEYIEICDIGDSKPNDSHYNCLFKTMKFGSEDIKSVLTYLYKDKFLTCIWLKYHDLPFDYIKKRLKELPIRNLLIRQQIPYQFLMDNIEIFKSDIDVVIQYQEYNFEEMRSICDMFDKWTILLLGGRFDKYSQNIVEDLELSKRLFKLIIGKYKNS